VSLALNAIDMHAHWVPPVLARALQQRLGQVPRTEQLPDGTERLVMPIGTLRFNAQHTDPTLRLAQMSRLGVAKQMLSLPGLFGIDSLPFAQSAPLVRAFNDACADLCQAHPDRFCGLASLPWANMDAAVAELRRARLELGLLGAILPVDAFRSEASAMRLLPVFEAAEALGAHFFVHPGRMPDSGALPTTPPDNDLARRALAVQHEVGEAMVTLLLSDFLQPWRNITVQVANLGGTFPAVVERMDHMLALREPDRAMPSSRARSVWVDCASLGTQALQQAVAVFGPDRVMLGTDCPIFDGARTIAGIHQSNLSPADQARVLHGNAQALLARLDFSNACLS
jgi:predicted TIM-barrel fold metal-dependent hydrolase